jgi:uncharacterized RDD family membrane protein YckC
MTNQSESTQIGVGLRLGEMLLDHFLMSLIAMPFFLPAVISTFIQTFKASQELGPPPDFMGGVTGYIALFGFALYLCKDILNGRSIAKRILNLQVVDNSTGKAASPIRCFVRNITCILWPIEVLVAIINTSRRLGDRIAGTKLVRFDPTSEQPKISFVGTIVPICISYGIILVLMQGIPKADWYRTIYSKTSYNQSESAALEKLLTDSLGQYLVPDIRIYDTVRNENLKYISVILKLKENYLNDEETYTKLKAQTVELIYSEFPRQTFMGHLQYTYRSPGQIQSRTATIGTYLKP